MKLVVWWCIPCKGILPIFIEYAKNYGEVRFIVEKEISMNREKLGWELDNISVNHFHFENLDHTNWENSVEKILTEEKESIHIFNGIRTFPKINYALIQAHKLNLHFGILAEAPHNPYRGIKRILKYFYTKYITKFLIRKYVKKAEFYFSASGAAKDNLLKLGWPAGKIFPFGYFTGYINSKYQTPHRNKIKIISTGYLTKNKGHILLLKALKKIGHLNEQFECNITGYGSEKKYLENYKNKKELTNVHFLGVVKTYQLEELMKTSDILIATGFEEPWGIRINEAIMHNLAIICSDGIGAKQLVTDLKCGMIFKRGSYKELAKCLIEYTKEEQLLNLHRENANKAKINISPERAANYIYKSLMSVYGARKYTVGPPWLAS